MTIHEDYKDQKDQKDFEKLVLVTLSFFETMTFSQIILDFDSDLLKDFPDFGKEQLQSTLDLLERKKLVKRVIVDKEMGWIRVQLKRSWWKRFFFL